MSQKSKLLECAEQIARDYIQQDFRSTQIREISCEYVLIALMKIGDPEPFMADLSKFDKSEYVTLRSRLAGGNPLRMGRMGLRTTVSMMGPPSNTADSEYAKILQVAGQSGDTLTAWAVFDAILANPTKFIASVKNPNYTAAGTSAGAQPSGGGSHFSFGRGSSSQPSQSSEPSGMPSGQAAGGEGRFFGSQTGPEAQAGAATRREGHKISQLFSHAKTKQDLRAHLLSKVIGQDEAVNQFVEGVMTSIMFGESPDGKRPRAIFLFAGPPGVGKTFLAESGAEELNIPIRRFDMSEFADSQGYERLVGQEEMYKGAKDGELTGFVQENNDHGQPSFLIFDEIEKAHQTTIHLFLQLLDAGRLEDTHSHKIVEFNNAYIVFTTNAGRSLYEGGKQPEKGLEKSVILDALRDDINPRTQEPFFPDAILSRLATGYMVMFRHLSAFDLTRISSKEMNKFGAKFQATYGSEIFFDDQIPFLLLLKLGGESDARRFRAESEKFIRAELFGLADSVPEEKLTALLKKQNRIRFMVDPNETGHLNQILEQGQMEELIVIIGNRSAAPASYEKLLKKKKCSAPIIVYNTYEEALEKLESGKVSPSLVLVDLPDEVGGATQVFSGLSPLLSSSYKPFLDFLDDASKALDGVPLYVVLDEAAYAGTNMVSDLLNYEVEETINFTGDEEQFAEHIEGLLRKNRLALVAYAFAREKKALTFTTAPGNIDGEVVIRLRNFEKTTLVSGKDTDSMVTEDRMPTTTFEDIIGQESVKAEVREFITFLQNPKKFKAISSEQPKGLLLYGPPGTGKTYFAKALAHEAGVPFFQSNGSSFVTEFVGSGPKAIRELFAKARRYAPSIVFIDEIDAIGQERKMNGFNRSAEETLNMLLSEMDGFGVDEKRPIFVVAATNAGIERTNGGACLDPALVRRFSRTVFVDLPSEDDRLEYLKRQLKKYNLVLDDDMVLSIAKRSMGMNFGNLKNLIEKARRDARANGGKLTGEILDNALETILYGEKKEWDPAELESTAWHECGHALLNYLSGETPEYITITARGDFGGYVMPAIRENKGAYNQRELLNRIRTVLAGRAAEFVRYGKEGMNTGISSDYEKACKYAARYIATYAMDDELGLVWVPDVDNPPKEVRDRVHEILEQLMKETVQVIQDNYKVMEKFVAQILRSNKMTKSEIEAVLSHGAKRPDNF